MGRQMATTGATFPSPVELMTAVAYPTNRLRCNKYREHVDFAVLFDLENFP